jgi:hypothetical protein
VTTFFVRANEDDPGTLEGALNAQQYLDGHPEFLCAALEFFDGCHSDPSQM